jgi:hypothetical protein
MGEKEKPMKSAIDLALERTTRFKKDAKDAALPEEKRKRISEIEKEYQAKVAETEILLESRLKKVVQTLAPEEAPIQIEALREEFQKDRESLNKKKVLEIEKVKGLPPT